VAVVDAGNPAELAKASWDDLFETLIGFQPNRAYTSNELISIETSRRLVLAIQAAQESADALAAQVLWLTRVGVVLTIVLVVLAIRAG
jgi:hypothetical protein